MCAPAIAATERRVGLVIGIGRYERIGTLSNPGNDARLVGAALEKLDFEIQVVVDPDHEALKRALQNFRHRLAGATTALLYYAGHGLQVAGRNYLLPTNAIINEPADLRYEAFDVQGILDEEMEGPGRVKLVFLDACRDNPLSRSLGARRGGRSAAVGQGLGRIETQTGGTLIAYATAPDTVAADGEGGNSPFTTALVRYIATPGLDIRQMLTRVRADVQSATNGQQRPWVNESLDADFYLVPAPPVPLAVTSEVVFWQSVSGSDNPADFAAYLERFPGGDFAPLARSRIAALAPRRDDGQAPKQRFALVAPITDAERSEREHREATPNDGHGQDPEWRAIGTALVRFGHHRGPVDAVHGAALRAAILARQAFEGAEETGNLSAGQRADLLRDADRLTALLNVPAKSPRGTPSGDVKGVQARFDRGWAFEKGKGQPRDDAEAAYWYALAAADLAVACTNLGTLHARNGNLEVAQLLWRTAVARGEGSAAFNLGAMAERGFDGPANPDLAKRWYARGAKLGNVDSAAALKRLDG